MICKNCNRSIADNSKFCEFCGTRVDSYSKPQSLQQEEYQQPRPEVHYQPQQLFNNKPANVNYYKGGIAVLLIMVIALAALYVFNQKDNKDNNIAVNSGYSTNQNSDGSYSNTQNNNNNGGSYTDTSSGSGYNNTSSTQASSSTSESQSQSTNTQAQEDIGSLTIDIGGNTKTYRATSALDNSIGNGWSVILNYDKYSKNDSFYLNFPGDVAGGDVITIDSKDVGFSGSSYVPNFPSLSVSYTNTSGTNYQFGYPLGTYDGGQHHSSRVTVSVDRWEGMGGYATGTISGELWLTQSDVVRFSNGSFRIKIKSSGF